jgi:hypothetical protein
VTAVVELVAFVRQQLEVAEAEAYAILEPPPGYYDKGWQADKLREFANRQLDEVEAKAKAKRRILGEAAEAIAEFERTDVVGGWPNIGKMQLARIMIEHMAQPYAGRDGWRTEWAVQHLPYNEVVDYPPDDQTG